MAEKIKSINKQSAPTKDKKSKFIVTKTFSENGKSFQEIIESYLKTASFK